MLAFMVAPAVAIEGRATVIDGDTIAVEGMGPRIRLDAIDAPESVQPCFDSSGTKYLCGARAAESLADIIGRNGRVACVEKERDRYGRIVAVCTVGAIEINRELVRRGWAIEYKKYSDGRYSGAEQEARSAKAGLWAGAFDEPAEWRQSKRAGEVIDPTAVGTPVAPVGFMATAAAIASVKSMPTTSATSCKAVKSCREAVIPMVQRIQSRRCRWRRHPLRERLQVADASGAIQEGNRLRKVV
jgi:endonuclease YncB( thermonuclease family)